MTKKEYLQALKEALQNYSPNFQNDIIDAFEDHFQEGLNEGRSEEEIMNDLGSIDDVLENIHMMSDESHTKQEKQDNYSELKDSLTNALHAFTRIADEAMGQAKNFTEVLRTRNTEHRHSYGETVSAKIDDAAIHHLKIQTTRSLSSLDINLVSGNTLFYEFHQSKSIFTNRSADIINVETTHDQAFIKISGSGELYIQIPNTIQSITTDILSGDLTIENIQLEQLLCKGSVGDVEIKNTHVKQADFDLKAGDLDVTDTNFIDLNLHMNAGDIDLSNTTGNIHANLSAGDLDISRHTGEYIEINSAAGDIDMEVYTPNIRLKTTAGDIDIHAYGEIQNIELLTTAGDIDLQTESDDYTATLSTSFGDIAFDDSKPFQKLNGKNYVVGSGKAKISIKTSAGDIDLH